MLYSSTTGRSKDTEKEIIIIKNRELAKYPYFVLLNGQNILLVILIDESMILFAKTIAFLCSP